MCWVISSDGVNTFLPEHSAKTTLVGLVRSSEREMLPTVRTMIRKDKAGQADPVSGQIRVELRADLVRLHNFGNHRVSFVMSTGFVDSAVCSVAQYALDHPGLAAY